MKLVKRDFECILFTLTKENDIIVSQEFLCNCPLNAGHKIDKILSGMFHESYKMVSKMPPDVNGLAPTWMEGIINGQVVQDSEKQNPIFKVIVVIVGISVLAWIILFVLAK